MVSKKTKSKKSEQKKINHEDTNAVGKKNTAIDTQSGKSSKESETIEKKIDAPVIKKADPPSKPVQFRIIVGSYEHNLLCLSLLLTKTPLFQPIFHFQAHSLSIKSIDLAKRYLVTGSNDEHIRIYDLQKRKELGTLLSHVGTITTLRFSSEGLNDTEQVNESTDKSGKWLLSGSEDGNIIIWRTKDWETFGTLKGHKGRINDISIHPSGRVAISVGADNTIRLWNLMTAKKAAILKLKGRDHLGQAGEYVRWSKDGSFFVVGLLNQILLYKTTNAKIFKKMKFKSSLMHMELYSFDGDEYLVTGHSNGSLSFYKFETLLDNQDDTTEKVNEKLAEIIEPEFVLQGHTNRIKDFTIINNEDTNHETFLVSVSSDGKIVVWDIKLKDQVAIYDSGERLNCVAVAPESVEKSSTMKRRYNEIEINPSESEYETDGEEFVSKPVSKKKGKKSKKTRVTVQLE